MSIRKPRIAFIDVETAPVLAAIWPPLHETNSVWVERGTYLFGFGILMLGEKRVKTYFLPDYPAFKKNIHDDKALCADLHRIIESADIVVAHNGDRFDMKVIRSRLLINGYSPPSPPKQIDTLKWLRSQFRMDSNRLDAFGQATGIGRKIPNTGAALWRGCYHGDRKAFQTMARYCAQDVRLLERAYFKLREWSPNHPNLTLYGGGTCPTCQSNHVQMRGFDVTRSKKHQRMHCQDCGSWFRAPSLKKKSAA